MDLLRRGVRRVRGRVSKHARRISHRLRQPQRRVAAAVRRLPLPAGVRQRLYRSLPWRPGTVDVPLDRLLLGAQNGLSAYQYAARTGDLLWGSRLVIEGPHAQLLRAAATGPELSDDALLASPYAGLARNVIAQTGNFFEATDSEGILEVARDYVARFRTGRQPEHSVTVGRSAAGTDIRVTPIKGSSCFQVVDGHHRVALLGATGETHARVRRSWVRHTTPLQDHLEKMSWIDGERVLYQPIEAPELADSWPVVRRCTDRLAKMHAVLADLDLPDRPGYLDVASCYGWFVAQMQAAGYDAHGIELDPLAPVLGSAAYGLDPGRIRIGNVIDVLSSTEERWDVVSCLSLLHHFALGRTGMDAATFAGLLDRVTSRVLFLDTGQSHEEWLRRRLPDWHTEQVRDFLAAHTTFDEIVDLGPDEDAVPPYEQNYGRHLFACIRR